MLISLVLNEFDLFLQEKKFKVFIENKIKYEKNIISDERMIEVMEKLVFFGEGSFFSYYV